MRGVVFFNNKGGVGKTTLACNMAAHIAAETNKSVLVVDLDPQCNATQLLLDDDKWESIYGQRKASLNKTIVRALRHFREGDSSLDSSVEILKSERFGVDVIPGHPSMSLVEDLLSESWGQFKQGLMGGARRSLWVRTLTESLSYDIVVIDVGPSLGALNRTALLGSDGFVTPMSADLFSLYALDNIADWTQSWTGEYRRAYTSLVETSPELDISGVPEAPDFLSGYLGFTVQQYVTKTKAGAVRSVKAYEKYKGQIPDRARGLLKESGLKEDSLDLGLVPNMFSMVPLAQSAHAPIRELTASDGVRGAQVSQRNRYVERLDAIAEQMMSNMGIKV